MEEKNAVVQWYLINKIRDGSVGKIYPVKSRHIF